MNENYADMDRRLSAIHQAHLTMQINAVNHKLKAHEKELMLMTLILVGLAITACYEEHRIGKLERHVLGAAKNTSNA